MAFLSLSSILRTVFAAAFMSISKFLPLVSSSLAYSILRREYDCIPACPKEWWIGVETPILKMGISFNLAFMI